MARLSGKRDQPHPLPTETGDTPFARVIFGDIDLEHFWKPSDFAAKEYVGEPLTPVLVAAVEATLGSKLPAAYVELMRSQNGGIPARTNHRIRPVPLIAHDRAGFGGGLASCGLTVLLIVWKARLTRDLWQALLFAGLVGFGCAIGVHYPIHYLIFSHLAPAWAGVVVYLLGMVCSRPSSKYGEPRRDDQPPGLTALRAGHPKNTGSPRGLQPLPPEADRGGAPGLVDGG